MPQRIEIPSAWQTVDPKTRDDLRRIRVALEQLELGMRELGTPATAGPSTQLATSGAPVNLAGPPPVAGYVLTALSATIAAWAPLPAFPALPGRLVARVHLGTAANTTAAGYQKVPLNTVTYDAAGLWVAGSLAFRPPVAGTYHVSLRARVASSALSAAAIGKNGAPVIAVGYEGGNQVAVGGGGLVQVNGTSDTIDAWVACGSVVAYTASGNDTYMDISGPFGP